jgi:glycosyltransferase involved in cell wall biosynthesis
MDSPAPHGFDEVRDSLLIVSHGFPPDLGGAQSVALQNATGLSREFNVEVMTATPAPDGYDEVYPFKVTRLSSPLGFWPLAYASALQRRGHQPYQACILNDPAAMYVAGLFAPDRLLRRSVAYLHGSEPEYFFQNPKLLYRITQYQRFMRKALDLCASIVTVSSYMKQKFLDATLMNHLEEKMEVVYAGVDLDDFYPDPIDVSRRHDLPAECRVLFSASRIVKKKGYADMLDVFTELCRRDDAHHWFIAGEGDDLSNLTSEVTKRDLEDRVTFLGRLDRDEMRRYYSASDVYWLLSEFKEAFGLVYIEANACGTPVIGRRRGGVAEAIQDGITGFLIDDPDECVDILQGGAYADLDPSRVIEEARTFSLRRSAQNLTSVIDSVSHMDSVPHIEGT